MRPSIATSRSSSSRAASRASGSTSATSASARPRHSASASRNRPAATAASPRSSASRPAPGAAAQTGSHPAARLGHQRVAATPAISAGIRQAATRSRETCARSVLGRPRRRGAPPQLLGQPLRRNHPARRHQQQRQHRPPSRPAQSGPPAARTASPPQMPNSTTRLARHALSRAPTIVATGTGLATCKTPDVGSAITSLAGPRPGSILADAIGCTSIKVRHPAAGSSGASPIRARSTRRDSRP